MDRDVIALMYHLVDVVFNPSDVRKIWKYLNNACTCGESQVEQ